MNLIEENSIKRISNGLEGFHRSNGHYNFRCPYCGDSAKSKLKKRGWFFQHDGKVFYKCFNCDKSASYSTFLKDWFPEEYDRYLADRVFLDGKESVVKNITVDSIFISEEEFSTLKDVQPCENNIGGKYLDNRKITNKEHFYYTENYGQLLRSLKLDTYQHEFDVNEPRLLIPHFNRKNQLAYLQMRCLAPNAKIRYRTYKVIEDEYKLWNLNNINLNKKIYVAEGALDASFVDNCVAMSGSDAQLEKSILGSVKNNLRIILDNEPRSPVILEKYLSLIKRGYWVFRWPNIPYKDINECILNNYDITSEIYKDDNYFNGLRGEFEFAQWKKY